MDLIPDQSVVNVASHPLHRDADRQIQFEQNSVHPPPMLYFF